MRAFVLLVLTQLSNTQPVVVRDEGVRQGAGSASTLNCVGAGVTCMKSGATMTLTIPGGGPSGGYDGGKVDEAYAADAAGFATVAGYASVAGTADAAGFSNTTASFAANPTDCAATQYASAIDSAGNLTCSTPAGGGSSGPIPSFGGF